jgi:hypothetical protein
MTEASGLVEAGHQARVVVTGGSQENATSVIDALRDDRELVDAMVPTPAGLEVTSAGEFGDVKVVQDFIIAVAGGITVEGLKTIVANALGRAPDPADEPSPDLKMSVTVEAKVPGLVEVNITIVGHSA